MSPWVRNSTSVTRKKPSRSFTKSLSRTGGRESQTPDGAEQGAVDVDEKLAVPTSERLEWACRRQLHPIYMCVERGSEFAEASGRLPSR